MCIRDSLRLYCCLRYFAHLPRPMVGPQVLHQDVESMDASCTWDRCHHWSQRDRRRNQGARCQTYSSFNYLAKIPKLVILKLIRYCVIMLAQTTCSFCIFNSNLITQVILLSNLPSEVYWQLAILNLKHMASRSLIGQWYSLCLNA